MGTFPSTAWTALRDSTGNLIKYNFGNTDWIPLMLRNSSHIVHPRRSWPTISPH